MNKRTGLILTVLLLCSGYVFADSIEVGNKICPVDGIEIGSSGEAVKVEREGKTYNLCSAECLKAFNEDAEKYHTIADKEMGIEGEDHDESEHGDHDHKEDKKDDHDDHEGHSHK